MDSTPSSTPRHRRLSELLEEKQEPFMLDVFLLERGYLKKAADLSVAAAPCWPGSGKTQGVLAQVEGVLKSMIGALLTHNDKSNRGRRSKGRKSHSSACTWSSEFEVGSIASSSGSSSICVGEGNQVLVGKGRGRTKGSDAGMRVIEWDGQGAEQDSKQLSPVSVFELQSEDSDSPAHEQFRQKEQASTASSSSRTNQTETEASGASRQHRTPNMFWGSDRKVRQLVSWQHLRYEVSLEEEVTTTRMVESDVLGASRKEMCRRLVTEVQEIGAEIADEILERLLCSCVSEDISDFVDSGTVIPCTLRWLMLNT